MHAHPASSVCIAAPDTAYVRLHAGCLLHMYIYAVSDAAMYKAAPRLPRLPYMLQCIRLHLGYLGCLICTGYCIYTYAVTHTLFSPHAANGLPW